MTLPPQSWDTHIYLPPDRASTGATSLAGHLVKASPAHNFALCMSITDSPDTLPVFIDTITALNEMHRRARGTVILRPDEMTPTRLRTLQSQGIRSIRLHIVRIAMDLGADIGNVEKVISGTAQRLHGEGLSWPIDAQLSLSTWSRLSELLVKLHQEFGTTFIADHMFCAGPDSAGSKDFGRCLDLVERGIVHVKISGLAKYAPAGIETLRPIIEQVLRCRGGDMALWGSDWPHVDLEGDRAEVDVEEQLSRLKDICQGLGEGYWEKLTVENAQRLLL
ncbi:hypothetical protein DB88DRAFT_483853 [Papiliotrema laurentii]|uniref:Amidohydrolase-related domain-containing protein n=1 Tax=Papiliotrema laurentii TaxID=5418 RepID=A0AAD9L7J6_PAPLA|nr:hypothetical protein DB88DRAFT_483853 [Papiliotrema laurentii]